MYKAKFITSPSTKLEQVSAHRLQNLSCTRYYYWRYILNIVPKSISLSYLYGSTMHKAFELLPKKVSLNRIKIEMRKVNQAKISEHAIGQGDYKEAQIQLVIAETIIEVYYNLLTEKGCEFETTQAEVEFSMKLNTVPVKLVGIIDAYSLDKDGVSLVEYKTASRLNNNYFRRLKFDKQINIYAKALASIVHKTPSVCHYLVFRKPQIRQNKGETEKLFLERLKEDLEVKADWYFLEYDLKFQSEDIAAVMDDVEIVACELYKKYTDLGKNGVLDFRNWPRNDNLCFQYGTCEYFNLCRSCPAHALYYKFYQSRKPYLIKGKN